MKQKTIKLTGIKEYEFVKLLAWRFNVTGFTEVNILYSFVNYGLYAPFNLDKYLRESIINQFSLNEKTFSVSVKRLVDKGCISKEGKSYYLNPAFSNLNDVDQIVFRF